MIFNKSILLSNLVKKFKNFWWTRAEADSIYVQDYLHKKEICWGKKALLTILAQITGILFSFFPFRFMEGRKSCLLGEEKRKKSLLFNCALIVIYCSVSFTVLGFSRAEKTWRNTVYKCVFSALPWGGHTFQLATH